MRQTGRSKEADMYVKVTAGGGPDVPTGNFLAEVHGELFYDTHATPLGENAVWESDRLQSPGDIDFRALLRVDVALSLTVLEFSIAHKEYLEAGRVVPFRFVWWRDPKEGLRGVVTTRNIFILGDNGKTIDRV